MLKTITKFVLQRRRRVQQPQPQIVEEDGRRDPAVASGDLSETAEGHREHDMEVGHREQFSLAIGDPLVAGQALAFWAVPVAAG
jgi:hypothetical protein